MKNLVNIFPSFNIRYIKKNDTEEDPFKSHKFNSFKDTLYGHDLSQTALSRLDKIYDLLSSNMFDKEQLKALSEKSKNSSHFGEAVLPLLEKICFLFDSHKKQKRDQIRLFFAHKSSMNLCASGALEALHLLIYNFSPSNRLFSFKCRLIEQIANSYIQAPRAQDDEHRPQWILEREELSQETHIFHSLLLSINEEYHLGLDSDLTNQSTYIHPLTGPELTHWRDFLQSKTLSHHYLEFLAEHLKPPSLSRFIHIKSQFKKSEIDDTTVCHSDPVLNPKNLYIDWDSTVIFNKGSFKKNIRIRYGLKTFDFKSNQLKTFLHLCKDYSHPAFDKIKDINSLVHSQLRFLRLLPHDVIVDLQKYLTDKLQPNEYSEEKVQALEILRRIRRCHKFIVEPSKLLLNPRVHLNRNTINDNFILQALHESLAEQKELYYYPPIQGREYRQALLDIFGVDLWEEMKCFCITLEKTPFPRLLKDEKIFILARYFIESLNKHYPGNQVVSKFDQEQFKRDLKVINPHNSYIWCSDKGLGLRKALEKYKLFSYYSYKSVEARRFIELEGVQCALKSEVDFLVNKKLFTKLYLVASSKYVNTLSMVLNDNEAVEQFFIHFNLQIPDHCRQMLWSIFNHNPRLSQAIVNTKRLDGFIDHKGNTILFYAIYGKSFEALRDLIARNIFLEKNDASGRTPLILSILQGKTEAALQLIDKKVCLGCPDKFGLTSLYYAIQKNNIFVCRHLIDHLSAMKYDFNAPKCLNLPPFLYAISLKRELLSIMLLSKTSKIDFQDQSRSTALMFAIKYSDISSGFILINKGASLSIKDIFGRTPLHIAALYPSELLDLIIQKLKLMDKAEATKLIDLSDARHRTPLFYAIKAPNLRKRSSATIFKLLSIGANIEHQDLMGLTPLIYATLQEDSDIIEGLLSAGANIEAVDAKGRTSLMRAIFNKKLSTIKLLVSKGSCINHQDAKGRSVLMYAIGSGDWAVFSYLLSKNPDFNYQSSNGTTALMYAGLTRDLGYVKALISHGADHKLKNVYGQTALDMTKNKDIISYLKSLPKHKYDLRPRSRNLVFTSSDDSPRPNKRQRL